jgi:nicotinic acid mononucleotide adenylyltransferase/ribosomal protein S14
MAVPVSESIAFSVGITMKCAFAAGRFEPPTTGHASMIKLIIEAAGAPERAYVIVSTAGDPKPLKEGEEAPTTPEDIAKQQFPNAEEKLKNPLTSAEKIEYLTKMFPGVNFVSAKEANGGGPLGAWAYVKEKECKEIQLVAGSDRRKEFDPKAAYETALTHMWDKPLELEKWAIPLDEEGKKLKRGEDGYDPSPEEADRIMKENDKKRPNLTNQEIGVPTFVEAPRPDGAMSGTEARKRAVDGNLPGFKEAVKVGNITDDEIEAMYTQIRKVCLDKSLLARAAEQRANREKKAAREELKDKPKSKRGLPKARRGGAESEEEEVSFFDADEESPTPPEGGRRRRTYRRCRKCGLPKKPETK